VSELENNNYAIVNTPIEMDEAKLQQIKGVIESDEMLKSAFKKLVFESRFKKFNREQVAKCVELLVQTSLHHGVREDDVLFLDSKFYFGRLRELGLIQKRKEGPPKSFKWVIHSRLQTRLDEVHKKFGENINDYLLKLYAYKDYGAQVSAASEVGNDALAEARKFLYRSIGLTQSAKDNLGVAFHAYESGTDAVRSVQNPRGAVQHCIQAFEALSNAFFEIDGTMASFQRADLEAVRDRWQGHWYADESLAEFYGRIDRFRETESAGDASQVGHSLESLFNSIIERLKTVVEDVADSNASVGLLHNVSHHTTDEIALFDRIRGDFFSPDRNAHFEYVKRMTDYLEERFRSFLYVTTQMIFGKNYFDHVPGKQTKQYAYKNLSGRGNFASVENLYVGLTRPQFRQIFVEGGPIKTQVVDALSMPWLSTDWDKFFDTFAIRNIETAHHQRAAFSARDRPSYLNYCRMAEQLLAGLNKLVSRSLTDYAFILADDHRPTSPEDCTVKFCFKVKEAKDAPMPESHVLTQDRAKMLGASPAEPISLDSAALLRVRDLLIMKLDASVRGFHPEDITNIEYIVNHYNVPFIEFLALLVYLLRVERSIQVVPWFGSAVLVRRGV
jgi:hypothetical protein